MQKKVLTQTAVSGESSTADLATVRLVARVDPHMLPQFVILEEGLAALLAHRLLLSLVLRQYVLIQIFLRDKSLVTQRTLVLRLVMRVLLMSVETVAVPAGLAAHVAYHRRFTMIQSGVRGQVALDLELLAAVLARVAKVLRVLSHEMRSQSLLASADQAADDASKFTLATGELVRASLVLLSQMRDHGRSLVAAKLARPARESLLISRHCVGERRIFPHVRLALTLDFRCVSVLVLFQ